MFDYSHIYGIGVGVPAWLPLFGVTLVVLIIWSTVWKGLALWHSARRAEYVWFIVLLLVNTAGILELVYLFLIKKIRPHDLFKP